MPAWVAAIVLFPINCLHLVHIYRSRSSRQSTSMGVHRAGTRTRPNRFTTSSSTTKASTCHRNSSRHLSRRTTTTKRLHANSKAKPPRWSVKMANSERTSYNTHPINTWTWNLNNTIKTQITIEIRICNLRRRRNRSTISSFYMTPVLHSRHRDELGHNRRRPISKSTRTVQWRWMPGSKTSRRIITEDFHCISNKTAANSRFKICSKCTKVHSTRRCTNRFHNW